MYANLEKLITCKLICAGSIALSADNSTMPYKQPNISEMNYVLIKESENISVPITDSLKLWKHEKFDAKAEVIILVTGWTTDINATNTCSDILYQAYKARGNYNFILIDTALYVDTLYAWSAFNTKELGEGLGKGLAELIEFVPVENIHVMGHSLGAHIVGSAGRQFQLDTNGKMLPRITGLDPAKPCFKEGELLNGLGRGDATFVDIIHSDSGALGKSDPIGDADFYPNGIVSLMPGCLTIFCSHSRAYEYFAESVYPGNENNFLAKKCGSLKSYEINACLLQEVPMGYACPNTTKGNFFLKTNQESPFGHKKADAETKDPAPEQVDTTEDDASATTTEEDTAQTTEKPADAVTQAAPLPLATSSATTKKGFFSFL